jgi:hypothetical protein
MGTIKMIARATTNFRKAREQQENEQNAKRENVNRAVAREFLLERYLRPLGREAGRQNLFSETFNGGKRSPLLAPGAG